MSVPVKYAAVTVCGLEEKRGFAKAGISFGFPSRGSCHGVTDEV